MEHTSTLTNYDANAADFDQFRQPSPTIAVRFTNAFSENEGPILSIGCGTGQYEYILSKKSTIFGLDRSMGMLGIAKERIQNVTLGNMISLPFASRKFSGAYFMQSLHHVGANLSIRSEHRNDARRKVLSEAKRVVNRGRIILVQRDPSQNRAVWFWKYFPKAVETKMVFQPEIKMIVTWLENTGLKNVKAEAIQDPMIQGFYDPKAPLDPGFRCSFSEFSYLSDKDMQIGLQKLNLAINDGSVFDDIEMCKLRFAEIGGTVFMVSGEKV